MTSHPNFLLADLLTAGGAAMGAANTRLTAGQVPALLRSYDISLTFPGSIRVLPGAAGLLVTRPRPRRCLTPLRREANIRIEATYIAAPSLVPVPPT
ncbi:MAG: hypothetical protein ACOY93_23335 [Bacillota bacterium]